jgi:hypothetical protein
MRAISSAQLRFVIEPPPEDAQGLPSWAHQQLINLSLSLQQIAEGQLEKQHAQPDKPRDGMLRYFDGADYNPGSGEGFYGFYGNAWHFLG